MNADPGAASPVPDTASPDLGAASPAPDAASPDLGAAVRRAAAAGGGAAVLGLARQARGPIVAPGPAPGSYEVTFVYHDRKAEPHAVGLFCPAIPGGYARLAPVGSGVFAASFRLPAGTRVKYHFCPDPPDHLDAGELFRLAHSPTARRMDYLNPHFDQVHLRGLRVRMLDSLLTLPGAPAAPATGPTNTPTAVPANTPGTGSRTGPSARPTNTPGSGLVPAGTVRQLSLPGAGRSRAMAVYQPAGHPAGGPYPLVLLLFGNDEWRGQGLLDNLIASGMVPPFVAVQPAGAAFTARLRDLAGDDGYLRFLMDDLLPALTDADPALSTEDICVVGYSAGAVAAALLCAADPARFTRLGLVSGALHIGAGTAFWRPGAGDTRLLDRYRELTAVPARAYLSAGLYEDFWQREILEQTEALAALFRARGARVRLDTGPTGHDTVSARAYLAQALAFLLSVG